MSIKEEIAKNILKYRTSKGMTQKELAEKLGVKNTSVSNWENGNNSIDIDTLLKACEILGVTITDMYGAYATSTGNLTFTGKSPSEKRKRIPVYGNIAAGVPIEEVKDIEDWEDFEINGNNGHDYIALRIKGDSMSPRICDGDIIIIRLQPTIENGELAAVRVNDGFTDSVDATCKRVKFTDDGGIMLVSLNPEFPPMYYSRKDIVEKGVEIIGKVVELRGKL